MNKYLPVSILVFALLISTVFGQSVNPAFWITNGSVKTIVNDHDTVYVGGNFTRVSPATGGGVIVSTGGNGDTISNFPHVCGSVRVSVPDGIGGWYIGGSFTCVKGVPLNNLAHINSNLSVDASFNPNITGGDVYSIAVHGNILYIGGTFTKITNIVRTHLGAVNRTTGLLTSWNPVLAPVSSSGLVYTIEPAGNNVFIGGGFTTVNGASRKGIAEVDTGGTGALHTWDPTSFCPNLLNGYVVRDLLVSRNVIYAAGDFDTLGGCSLRKGLVALDTVTAMQTAWDPCTQISSNTSGSFYSIALSGDTLFVGGSFSKIGGISRLDLASIDTSGTGSVHSWFCNTTTGTIVYGIAVSGNNLYAAGTFTIIGGVLRNGLASVSRSLSITTNWNPDPNVAGLFCVAISGAKLYAGGDFTGLRGFTRNGIYRFNSNSAVVDPLWNPDVNAPSTINCIAIKDSSVYIGGNFTSIGALPGVPRLRIAQLAKSGIGAVQPWNPGVGNGAVETMAFSVTNDKLFIGGTFTNTSTVGGAVRKGIAALNPNGNIALSWDAQANGTVHILAVRGSLLYAGGTFDSIGGSLRKRIAALDINTTNATAWNPGNLIGASGTYVQGFAFDNLNNVYAGGNFTGMGGSGGVSGSHKNLSKINLTTGLADGAFNAQPTSNVNTVYVENDTTVYAGGGFTLVNGSITRNRAASFRSVNGAVSTSWDPNLNTGAVNIITQAGGSIMIGGSFMCVTNSQTPSSNFTGFLGVCNTNFANAGSDGHICPGDSIQLDAGASNGITYSWTPSTGLSNPNIRNPWAKPLVTTTYCVNVGSISGCFSSDCLTITVDPSPALPNILVSPNDSVCTGDSISLMAVTPETIFHWSNGSSSQQIFTSVSGQFNVTVTNSFGCKTASDSVSVYVFAPPSVPVIGYTEPILAASGTNVTFQWYLNGSPIPGATSFFYDTHCVSGIYKVCSHNLADSLCSTCSNIYVVPICDTITDTTHTAVSELASHPDQLDIFPNPFTEKTMVSFQLYSSSDVTIEVYDILGNKIKALENSIQKSPGNYSYPLEIEEAGVYFIKLNTREGQVTRRIVKY